MFLVKATLYECDTTLIKDIYKIWSDLKIQGYFLLSENSIIVNELSSFIYKGKKAKFLKDGLYLTNWC